MSTSLILNCPFFFKDLCKPLFYVDVRRLQGKPSLPDRKIKNHGMLIALMCGGVHMKTYMFKINFKYNRRIRRRIELREDQTLDHLHKAIQDSIGWWDEHLYSFFMSGKPWDWDTQYEGPDIDPYFGYPPPKRSNISLKKLGLKHGQKFLCIFDYGDDHRFDITVEGIGEVREGQRYSSFIESKGKAPEQYYYENE